jgi:8-oxo-dGTP pyrophosphatase MutT (NUDIX family)
MAQITIDIIRDTLRDHAPRQHQVRSSTRQAAVSVVLRPAGDHTEALFILRSQKEGDPWSGHMAFPGGHFETHDESLRHTAERETLEEIGLDLARLGDFIGQIDPVQANPRGRNLDMIVTPFVYELREPIVEFDPNYEVADVLWGSLNDMHSGDSHTMGEFVVGGERVNYPGYGVGEEIVWGLTYRMLDQFFSVLDPHWIER